ncbi:FUSC family protein [Telmatospirillum siberiense]|nr:FUSC family protein [Telmatospirillum siberiense]
MEKIMDFGCFAVRCSLSAVLSYVVALRLGLPYPVWAPMSALIVSQEDLKTTRHAVTGRIAGTVLGVAIALIVAEFGDFMAIPEWLQLSLGVGICALCAKGRPAMRVSLWTCPLVLLTRIPSLSTEMTGLFRGSEVVIGAVVGGLAHLGENWLRRFAALLLRRRPAVRTTDDNRSWWRHDSEE